MSSRPREPEVERRHRLRRVLLDQRRQRLHVVVLERRDVAVEQRAVLVVERRARRSLARRLGRLPAWPAPAAARCSPTRRSCRAALRPRRPASGAPRRGSAPPAASAAAAAALRRTRAGSSRARRSSRQGRLRRATRLSGSGWIQVASGSVFRFASVGSRAGPRSIGRARRSRPFSMSKQTLVAIR